MSGRIQRVRPSTGSELLPVRMCNEFVYCPRLFYLEHVQGYFVDSSDTVEGKSQHARAAKKGAVRGSAPKAEDLAAEFEEDSALQSILNAHRTSVTLESSTLGVRGKLDFVEVHGDEVVVIEAKRGASPRDDDFEWSGHRLKYKAWPADVVQLGLYMALLRESGVPCERGQILYRKNRTRIEVVWSDELEKFVHSVVVAAGETTKQERPPAPLVQSPKCPRCSLHTICLPDEHLALSCEAQGQSVPAVRRIVPGRDDRSVLHVLTPGSALHKDGDGVRVVVRGDPEPERVLIKDLAQVALYGPSKVTAQCLNMLLMHDVPVAHHTGAGRLLGMTMPLATRNVAMRRAQFRTADDSSRCLVAARALVVAKIRNQRTVLRRYRSGRTVEADCPDDSLPGWAEPDETHADDESEASTRAALMNAALERMRNAWRRAKTAQSLETLRGHEGDAAAAYFEALPLVLPSAWRTERNGRSRRPPRDRVNAMLGFGYALLARDTMAALGRVGLDPMVGVFHSAIAGRPALALDLLEPFRAAWVDTAILRLLATRGIEREHFVCHGDGVFLTDVGRRHLVAAYERRADETTTHPRFGYRLSYRRMLELEARVLGKWMLGEISDFSPLVTR